jgi:hypothetical protein
MFPDDLFKELVGNLDRVPRRHWPQAIAIAVALRHSWRRDGLERIARRLRLPHRPPKGRPPSPQSQQHRNRTRGAKALRVRKRSSGQIHGRAHDQHRQARFIITVPRSRGAATHNER